MILEWAPATTAEIAEACDIMMRAYRADHGNDDREALRSDLRDRLVEHLAEWAPQVIADTDCSRHVLHNVAEAMATFPSTSLLEPLRSLLSEDLRRWRTEKEELRATIARGDRPDPGSGARMSYAFRYGQNLLTLVTGRNADIARQEDDDDQSAPSSEMTDAVVDVLSDYLLDYEFGDEAGRVIATLVPDPIAEIGEPRRLLSYDLRVVPDRRKFREEEGPGTVGPAARQIVDAISELREDGGPEALQHAIKLASSAVRIGCREYLGSITEMVVKHGSLENISKHMILRLLFGHGVDGELAERCLNELDGRREAHRWEYEQNWFKWEELLVVPRCLRAD